MSNNGSTLKGLFAFLTLVLGGSVLLTQPGAMFDRLQISGVEKAPRGKGGGGKKPPTTTSPLNYPELSIIASNFDINSELVPAWGTGAIARASADLGSFQYSCNSTQLLREDPIDAPGASEATEIHEFVGNLAANGKSTYATLRGGGQSSCMSPVDRSSSWFPAMLDGRGSIVRPDYISTVFRRLPSTDPQCASQGKACIPFPNGLKFSMGRDILDAARATTGGAYFTCDGPGAVPGKYSGIAQAAKNCPTGARLGIVIESPSCWDGVNLDSADHRSHVAYKSSGWFSGANCPSSHPFYIPSFTMSVWYTTDDNLDRSGTWDPLKPTWHLTSDDVPGRPMAEPGSTFHVGWFGAWDNNVQAMWLGNCIEKKLVCSAGDLGNGKQIRSSWGFTWLANPRLVPDPAAVPVSGRAPVLVDDGDSISIFWGGNWTGIYAATRPTLQMHGLAVGGSGLVQLNERWPQVAAYKPTVVMVLIGANDLGNTYENPTADVFVEKIRAYAARAKSTGAKVIWGTILGSGYKDSTPQQKLEWDAKRRYVNQAIRGMMGQEIDAVIAFDSDFGVGTMAGMADPANALDGVHPTGPAYERMAAIAKPVIDAVVDGKPLPPTPAALPEPR